MSARSDIVLPGTLTADLDAGVKNSWRWDWLERSHEGELKRYKACFHKLKAAGKAYCSLCRSELSYGSIGARALKDHIVGKLHQQKIKGAGKNFRLPD